MAKLKNKILTELEARMRASNKRPCDGIELTMKHDGNKLTIIPCFENPENEPADCASLDLSKVDYILVRGNGPAIRMGGTVEQVCLQLACYQDNAIAYWRERKTIMEFAKANKDKPFDSDEYTQYSDWHKSLFGFRPDGWSCGKRRTA